MAGRVCICGHIHIALGVSDMRDIDEGIAKLHADLSELFNRVADLRDALPSGEAKAEARRYSQRLERALQQLERLM